MVQPAPAAVPIDYPSSNGRPMAENDAQRSAIMYGISALARHFKSRQDVYVSGDLLIYLSGYRTFQVISGHLTKY